ncbi:hypothetical protein BGS_0867 [Beggiatoa sp. SS]|nr:hypothetical protein BGS_0867 [Beggiatoa sp. SS]
MTDFLPGALYRQYHYLIHSFPRTYPLQLQNPTPSPPVSNLTRSFHFPPTLDALRPLQTHRTLNPPSLSSGQSIPMCPHTFFTLSQCPIHE